jgi:hypothetical protein
MVGGNAVKKQILSPALRKMWRVGQGILSVKKYLQIEEKCLYLRRKNNNYGDSPHKKPNSYGQ